MQKDFVTAEQVEKARSVDLLEYLQRTEPSNLKPSAPGEYRLIDHDSLKISKGKFHWFSRGIGGTNAIDYLVKVRGIEFKEAVRELAGEVSTITYATRAKRAPPGKPQRKDDERSFMLPPVNSHNNDVIEYLKGRGIEESVINDCIQKGLLYQNTNKCCVFVGYDNKQIPKFACERGIKSDYKKDVVGSNKAFNFCMPPITNDSNKQYVAEKLYVFESAVDCISHASIAQIGGTDWDGYRLSLSGVSSLALNTFLENNPQITNVYLCLDNDKPGKEATERICNEIISNEKYNHINVYLAPPPESIGKDYNDVLMVMQEKIKKRQLQNSVAADKQKPTVNRKHSAAAL